MSDPTFWCYAIATAHRTIGKQQESTKSWVGNRTGNFGPRFHWDKAEHHALDFIQRPYGEAIFTRANRGDIIVAESPEFMFSRPNDIINTLRMFAEKGLKLAFVRNPFGDLRTREARNACWRAALRIRKMQIEKVDLPTPIGWKRKGASFRKDMKRRGIGALVSLLRGKYRMTYAEIAKLFRRSACARKLSFLHRGFVAGWPMTFPERLPSIVNLQLPVSKATRKRHRLREMLLKGWRTLKEIEEHLGMDHRTANALVNAQARWGFVLKDVTETPTKYGWVDVSCEPELLERRRKIRALEKTERENVRHYLAERRRAFKKATGQTESSPPSASACDAESPPPASPSAYSEMGFVQAPASPEPVHPQCPRQSPDAV